MKKSAMIISAALALCPQLLAQNINQSVQVTNEYETKFADFQKQGLNLSVPDSINHFDYSFDYSVFDTPYKGSYEFTPYLIKMNPSASPYDGHTFYLRAGAGYTLHPVLELIYSPVTRKNLDLSVFDSGSGYYGDYYGRGDFSGFSGYDLTNSLGVSGHLTMPVNALAFGAGYDSIFTGNGNNNDGMHSFYLRGDFKSTVQSESYVSYDFGLDYRYSRDLLGNRGTLGEHVLSLNGSFGPVINQKYSFLMDFVFQLDSFNDSRSNFNDPSLGLAGITPHISFLLGPVDLDAGVRVDYNMNGGNNAFYLAPAVKARLSLLNDNLTVFAGLTGGQSLQSYYSLKSFSNFYIRINSCPLASREKFNSFIGVNGHYGSHLQAELSGGYAVYGNSPLEYFRTFTPVDYEMAYADLKASWNSDRLSVDGKFRFAYSMIPDGAMVYAPAAFSGDLRATYNWIKRIYAGLYLEGSTSRKDVYGLYGDVPGFVNLGAFGEYRLNSKWGFWLQAGNLLGMAIERHPGYIEKGPYFTAGVSLNL